MTRKRIWFNRWFSTAYNIIELLRNNDEGIDYEIYASHSNKLSMNLQIADRAFTEPKLYGEAYIDYCLDFCKTHSIDIVLPYYNLILFSKHRERFEALGTKVLVAEDYDLLRLIDDKARFYNAIKPLDIVKIPEYRVVTTKKGFMDAYQDIAAINKVCIKPTIGVGGAGFKKIVESERSFEDYLNSMSAYTSQLSDIMNLLTDEKVFDELMIMEYLDGYEYSIDCLADKNGTLKLAVPRRKIDSYNRYLENNQELIEIAEKISEAFKIPYVFNIQVKFHNAIPYLLEINTRMPGGIHYTSMCGFNFPHNALKALEGADINADRVQLDIMIGKTESLRINHIIE